MARPKKKIDPEIVEALARIQCTHAEIAAVVGVHESTIFRRFASRIAGWREAGKMSLRRMQWKSAKAGSDRMLIHLGEQYLDQRQKREVDVRDKTDEQRQQGFLGRRVADISRLMAGPRIGGGNGRPQGGDGLAGNGQGGDGESA